MSSIHKLEIIYSICALKEGIVVKMETLVVAGGEINMESLRKYCEEHIRAKYYCS